MKTAISLPDELFEEMEQLVRESGRSRSELYAAALHEYVARHAPERVTDALNKIVCEPGSPEDKAAQAFVARAADRTLARTDW